VSALIDSVKLNDRTFAGSIKRAARRGDRVFMDAPGGSITFWELPEQVARTAGALAMAGASQSTRVAIFLNNRVEFVLGWWGSIWAGSATALIHSDFKGAVLERALSRLSPELIITEAALLDRLEPLLARLPPVRSVIIVGDMPADPAAKYVSWNALRAEARAIGPAPTGAAAMGTIMLTSGTTGPSKLVCKSQHFDFVYSAMAAEGIGLAEGDCIWSASPCTHVRTANCAIYAALLVGARVVIGARFSATTYWEDLRAAGATHTYISNWMANLLAKRNAADIDRTHGVRVIHCMPPPGDPIAFAERFGIKLTGQGYGSTECYPLPQQLTQQDWTRRNGFLGLPHPLMEVKVADEMGIAVPADGKSTGEILVRPRLPMAVFSGYLGDPQATADAFRDLWFHTGDSATVDADGNLYFVGRIGDAIRRRGENISAWEIEQAILVYPGVAEAAAYGVANEFGEQEVKLDIAADPGALLDPATLADYLTRELPRFMVPRYVEIRDSLPKTPTGRVEKFTLRAMPVGDQAFDRERLRVAS